VDRNSRPPSSSSNSIPLISMQPIHDQALPYNRAVYGKVRYRCARCTEHGSPRPAWQVFLSLQVGCEHAALINADSARFRLRRFIVPEHGHD
jgi:hypothetical protein